MNRVLLLIAFFISSSNLVLAQANYFQLGKLKADLIKTKEDSTKCRLMQDIASAYRQSNFDSSRFYADSCVMLANKIGNEKLKAKALSIKGYTLIYSGRLPESLQCEYEALKISEKIKDTEGRALALNRIGNVYMELGDYSKANDYYFLSKDLYTTIGDIGRYNNELSNIGNVYNLMNKPDSALYYHNMVYKASKETKDRISFTRPEMFFRIGNSYKLKADTAMAIKSCRQGIIEAYTDHDLRNLSMNELLLAKIYFENNQFDSSINFAMSSYQVAQTVGFISGIQESASFISELFNKKGKYDSVYKYLQISSIAKDSITGKKRLKELQKTILNELEEKRNNEDQLIKKENIQKQIGLIAGLVIAIAVVAFLYRNNKQKQKTNTKLELTLSNLQATQKQLIQSEKMASLGELTAGIAHEIQNPLNFVNNFSEVNTELIDELQQELKTGNTEEAIAISNDIKENEQKINHHGKRADSIVKGMLQHSRSSSGQKEPTDINALCDEYLRLAYHGLRAKDKSFNATMVTNFDSAIGKVTVIPQDMGRVVLNLITNAFYAVSDKKKKGGEGYEPTVTISTQKQGNRVMIIVKDNGSGIPEKVKEKIFQPFFTTKPTGEGTGLGLSMSYDIVTKGHGGELLIDSVEDSYAEFRIVLPI